MAAPPKPPESVWRASPQRAEAVRALSSFGRVLTLTEPPSKGLAEMERPLRALVRTLSKMKRRNAIVVGPPGTGKSALVYELARRLFRGDASIPAQLRDLDVFELSPAFLRSGASLVGQYDERVKQLLEVLKANPKIVLFVDEIHSLLQSGRHERSAFSEANEAFKTALGRGEVTCIGCTTPPEYRTHIEPDGALARRFSLIRVEPPSREATLKILEARQARLETHYAPLRVPRAVLKRAVELTDDYLTGRFQPDKSIQLLDEACAHCVTSEPPLPEVTEAALVQALEDMVGHGVIANRRLSEAEVLEQLRARLVGQDAMLASVARAFVAGLGGWVRTGGPRGVFLFAGPTGVGKTETALALARILGGGSREALVRVDCNTLQGDGHDPGPATYRLLGVPPGYLGYVRGEGGLLSRVRDLPECVVLFDELEKADPGVGKLLLRILDEGRVEDTEGSPLDFRRSFVVFTTNAGASYDAKTSFGFPTGDAPRAADGPGVEHESVLAALRSRGIGEEFLGRINHLFLFQGLPPDVVHRVVELQLEDLKRLAAERLLTLEWEPGVVAHLASQWQPRFGARALATILRNRVIEQLSVAEAQGEMEGISSVRIALLSLPSGSAEPLAGMAVRQREGAALVIRVA